tara:strand:+ start:2203 stop:2427 length:225 start_codon:yes stop_codon:yes gene_type:complete
MSNTLEFKHPLTKLYFEYTITDITEGSSIAQCEKSLRFFEQLELYEECQGIYLAIKYAKFFISLSKINYDYEVN